jgi:hypothetical protein
MVWLGLRALLPRATFYHSNDDVMKGIESDARTKES